MLIPGPIGARCVTVDHLQLDLGSVATGIGITATGHVVQLVLDAMRDMR